MPRPYRVRQAKRIKYHKTHDDEYANKCWHFIWDEYQTARKLLPECDENCDTPIWEMKHLCDSSAYLAALNRFQGQGFLPFLYFDQVARRIQVSKLLEQLFNTHDDGYVEMVLEFADMPKATGPDNKAIVELAHWVYHYRLLIIAGPIDTLCSNHLGYHSCSCCHAREQELKDAGVDIYSTDANFEDQLCRMHVAKFNCKWTFTCEPSPGSCGYCRYEWHIEPEEVWKYTIDEHCGSLGFLKNVST